jgi:4-hydroxy-tetrahydrodipicolinate synthase
MLAASTRIGCPLATPFEGEDGAQAVDHDALASLVEHVVEGGVDALIPCGTTGEFSSLTPAEQRAVIETTVAAAPDDVPVVAGASATAVEEARARVAAAADAGADAALVLPPYYLTATEPVGNERFFERVATDSPLPIYLYNIPSVVGGSIAPETVAAAAEHESVVGLKDSSGDLPHVSEVIARTPDDFQVFQGFDALVVPAVYAGAVGGINALSHLVPESMTAAVDAVRAGDHDRARALQRERIDPLFRFCAAYGFAPAIKVALEATGVVPSAAVRPPLTLPGDGDRAEIVETVERLRGGPD